MMVDLALRWNQKFLDYEIETGEYRVGRAVRTVVGIKSFSITRLKRNGSNYGGTYSGRCWNQKFLDYEIETWQVLMLIHRSLQLESKVSRLRD